MQDELEVIKKPDISLIGQLDEIQWESVVKPRSGSNCFGEGKPTRDRSRKSRKSSNL
jgi:hypothetical protein